MAVDTSKVPPSPSSRPASEVATSSPKISRSQQDTTKGVKGAAGEQEREKDQEQDWLTGALSRKKAKEEEKKGAQQDTLSLGEEDDLASFPR